MQRICCINLAAWQLSVEASAGRNKHVHKIAFFPKPRTSTKPIQLRLTVSPVALGVLALPGVAATGRGVVVAVALVDTTGLLAGSGKTTGFTVLYCGFHVSKLS